MYTDAVAKDPYRIREAQALVAQKQVTITFAYITLGFGKRSTNDGAQEEQHEETKRQTADEAYEILATFSGGQVLNVGTSDLSSLGQLVLYSADQSRTTILRERGYLTNSPYYFYMDSTIEQVIISINGYGFGITITSSSGT